MTRGLPLSTSRHAPRRAEGRSKWLRAMWLFALMCAAALCLHSARADGVPPARTLNNGMRVLARERHVSPLVAIDLWVRAGSREEGADETGSAHFLEHVLFKGTAARGIGQADVDIENLGGALNAATGPDYAHFYTTVATSHALQALHILADVIRNAALPDGEVERERGVILDELAQHDSDPSARMVDLLYANAYPLHPYGRSPAGSPDDIRLRGRDTLAAFYRRTYRPDRCTLVLVGDLLPEQARQWAEQAFGDWQPAPGANALPPGVPSVGGANDNTGRAAQVFGTPSDPPAFVAPARPLELAAPVSRVCVGLAFPAPPARDFQAAAAALLAAEIMGEAHRAGRLFGAMGTSEAGAHFTPRREASLWMLLASTPLLPPRANAGGQAQRGENGAKSADAGSRENTGNGREEQTLRRVLEGLRNAPPGASELQNAIRRLLSRQDGEWETNAGLAEAVGYADLTLAEPPEALRVRLLQTTTADVQRFLAHYVLSRPGLMVRLMPSPGIAPERALESNP